MKLLNLVALLFLLIGCASVDKGKAKDYEKMLQSLREGHLDDAIQTIQSSSYDKFDFYVRTERYNKPVKFIGISKQVIIKGLTNIKQSLNKCRGKVRCFEELGWSSARYFYPRNYALLGLDSSHVHEKYKLTIFDGEIPDSSSGWIEARKYNFREMLSNFKARTDKEIKKQINKQEATREAQSSKTLEEKMSNEDFRRCVVAKLVDSKKDSIQIAVQEHGYLKRTSFYHEKKELNDQLFAANVQNLTKLEKLYKNLSSKIGSASKGHCDKEKRYIHQNLKDLERRVRGFYNIN